MINRNRSTQAHATAGLQSPQPSSAAALAWMTILALAAISGSLVLSCVMPFAALAVALAGTLRLRAALSTMIAIWLTNQLVGFLFLGYPRTPSTFLGGVAIGGAALFSTLIASTVIKRASTWGRCSGLGFALLLSFAMYEVTLLGVSLFLGGVETFAPAIIAQLAFANVVWFVGLIVLNELAAALCKPWVGVAPRLARA